MGTTVDDLTQKVTRRYDLRRRAEQAAATRASIIAAAHALLDNLEAPQLTLDEVARAAGVSRATVYNQFGSRRALLAAVFEDLGRIIQYDRVQNAQVLEDPLEAVQATIREACHCWSSSPVAIRRILAFGAFDPEIDELNSRYERYRRVQMRTLAERLHSAGFITSGVTLDDAAAILSSLTNPHSFVLLSSETSTHAAAERLVHMAVASLGLQLKKENPT
jgi:AcrR family transcriptional regulator